MIQIPFTQVGHDSWFHAHEVYLLHFSNGLQLWLICCCWCGVILHPLLTINLFKTTTTPLHKQSGQLYKTNSPAFVHEGFFKSGWLHNDLQGFLSLMCDIFTCRRHHSIVFLVSLKPKLFTTRVHESFFSGWLQTHLLFCNMLPIKVFSLKEETSTPNLKP